LSNKEAWKKREWWNIAITIANYIEKNKSSKELDY